MAQPGGVRSEHLFTYFNNSPTPGVAFWISMDTSYIASLNNRRRTNTRHNAVHSNFLLAQGVRDVIFFLRHTPYSFLP
jgi:hypothetical protein